jgi:hypothetical protein
MSTYNSESALATACRGHEARALLREAFTLSSDVQIIDNALRVRLDPATA